MRAHGYIFVSLILLAHEARTASVTHYVDVNSTNPVAPYTNWNTAAVTIQDAVNSANNLDTVLVTNGVYSNGGASLNGSNRVYISKAITLRSVNGCAVTFIQGQPDPNTTFGTNSVRCIFIFSGSGAVIGFTITNGYTGSGMDGGGVSAPGALSVLLADCVVTGCHARTYGGGVSGSGGLVISNCIVAGNSSNNGGGGYGGSFVNCVITNNSASFNGGGVGGDVSPSGSLRGCFVGDNHAQSGGGTANCVATDSVFVFNFATSSGGGVGSGNVDNCLVLSNSAMIGGGVAGFMATNCTIVGNSAETCGGVYNTGGAAPEPDFANDIIYYNTATTSPNYGGRLLYIDSCCTIPAISAHDITNEPGFVNLTLGDFHLASNSPCINSGRNAKGAGNTDFESMPRIQGGTMDIGAYEYQNPTSLLSYAWLQNYGLPSDGSADFVDSDSDGVNNCQEWMANTDPGDSSSFLHLLAPKRTQSGVTVTWPSVTNQTYFIQRITNAISASWATLKANIPSASGTNVTTYTDTSATNAGPYIYRVGTSR